MGIRARSGGKFSTWGSLQAAVAIPLLHPNVSVRHRAADGTVRGSDAGLDLKALIQQHGAKPGYYLWLKRLSALDAWIARQAADAAMIEVALADAELQALVEDDMGSMGVHAHALIRTTGDANAPVKLTLIAANMVEDLGNVSEGQVNLLLATNQHGLASVQLSEELADSLDVDALTDGLVEAGEDCDDQYDPDNVHCADGVPGCRCMWNTRRVDDPSDTESTQSTEGITSVESMDGSASGSEPNAGVTVPSPAFVRAFQERIGGLLYDASATRPVNQNAGLAGLDLSQAYMQVDLADDPDAMVDDGLVWVRPDDYDDAAEFEAWLEGNTPVNDDPYPVGILMPLLGGGYLRGGVVCSNQTFQRWVPIGSEPWNMPRDVAVKGTVKARLCVQGNALEPGIEIHYDTQADTGVSGQVASVDEPRSVMCLLGEEADEATQTGREPSMVGASFAVATAFANARDSATLPQPASPQVIEHAFQPIQITAEDALEAALAGVKREGCVHMRAALIDELATHLGLGYVNEETSDSMRAVLAHMANPRELNDGQAFETSGLRPDWLCYIRLKRLLQRVALGTHDWRPSAPVYPHVASGGTVNMLGDEHWLSGEASDQLSGQKRVVLAAAASLGAAPGYVPALSDNGASMKTSCSRSLDGAVLSTHVSDDAGPLAGASQDTSLDSAGSYLYIHDWLDAGGRITRRVRRMRHTSQLLLHIVISENDETYSHNAEFRSNKRIGRVMTEADGSESKLFLSSVKLGWFKLRPVTDAKEVQAALMRYRNGQSDYVIHSPGVASAPVPKAESGAVHVLGDGLVKPSVSMSGTYVRKMRGVELLRYMHCIGHKGLRAILLELKAQGRGSDCVTREDCQQFVKDAAGHYRTRASENYKPLLCERTARAIIACCVRRRAARLLLPQTGG